MKFLYILLLIPSLAYGQPEDPISSTILNIINNTIEGASDLYNAASPYLAQNALGEGVTAGIVQMKEAEIADKASITKGGKTIRIVGEEVSKDAAVESTAIGRVVVIDQVTERTECSLVIEAPFKECKEEEPDCDPNAINAPELDRFLTSVTIIYDSCDEDRWCMWMVMLRGKACEKVADSSYYIGSTMREFVLLDPDTRGRIVKTEGDCRDKKGKPYFCYVPDRASNAKPGMPWIVPIMWSGRDDLRYVEAEDGVPVSRYKVDETGEVTEVNPSGEADKFVPVEAPKEEPIEEPVIEPGDTVIERIR